MSQSERERPQGAPLAEDIGEENQAQRQSDAPPDATARRREELTGTSDRSEGRGSTANGIPSSDPDDGELRKKQYEEGAGLVSGLD